MMIDLIKSNNSKYLRLFWCLLAVWILWQVGSVMARSAFLPRRVQKSLKHYKESSEKNEQAQSSTANPTQAPKSMFAPPTKRQMPKCTAVLGDEALINGNWYKVDSMAEGAKILSINPESVKILWEEKEHILVPFDVQIQDANNASGGRPASVGKETSARTGTGGRGMRNAESGVQRGPDGMPDERRQQMREQFQNATPEEREAMRREMRERFGRRGRRGEGG